MKNLKYNHLLIGGILLFIVACSTKKNTFVSRNMNALATRDNILYNGNIALDKGVADLKTQNTDNFWEVLPIERMQVSEDKLLPEETKKNTNFDRSETKAAKAIQKHSMNIGGTEKNPQMDEAYLLLGKTRYYGQRFVPALEAFNYVLYKYPTSDKINIVKIWREKTNMRLENDGVAATNLTKLLEEIKFKDQVYADANATLAQAYLNLEQKDSAISKLRIAKQYTESKEEKARYQFILGQLFDQMAKKDSAFVAYQRVIDMKRKSPRKYVIEAHAMQAQQFDFEKGDTLAFIEKYNDLLKDRENRPYLDVLNYQMGLFYDKSKKQTQAIKYYNASLKTKSQDNYLVASTYRNLGELYFNKAKYVTAGKYYDSTLTVLEPRSREFKFITKKRANLEDVIKYEGIAQQDDSILKVGGLSAEDKVKYYTDYIEKLKIADQKQKELLAKMEKEKKDSPVMGKTKNNSSGKEAFDSGDIPNPIKPSSSNSFSGSSNFYFYNPATVAFGKKEFAKKWGKRAHVENWRLSNVNDDNQSNNDVSDNNDNSNSKGNDTSEKEEIRYKPDFYIGQLPTSEKAMDSISKERNFAYYQLGVIYKEKFKDSKLAISKFEGLLENDPEERLILPSMYNLYKLYELTNSPKANEMKTRIISKYPGSRYAQILSNNSVDIGLGSPEEVYDKLYKDFEEGLYRETLVKTDMAIVQFTGEEMLPKYELLRANLVGKLYGLTEYKKALNYVALTYPNSEEGKETEKFIKTKIPILESLFFNDEVPDSWKVVYAPTVLNDSRVKPLLEKLNKFIKERTVEKLTLSTDVYTKDSDLIVIHGIKNEENASKIAQVLKEYKDYKIEMPATVISNTNYKIVQIYKNLEEYISGKGPNFETKQKPTIVLPKEDEVKQPVQPKKAPKTVKQDEAIQNTTSPIPEFQETKQPGKDIQAQPRSSAMPPGFKK